MGIKHLWTILTPFCERKPLHELVGKTVAIDLSCWICEAQNVADYTVHPKLYLRNLYFRTCYLLLMNVNPIFVLEGKAPELKYGTIAARNEIQFKGARPKKNDSKTSKDRSHFNAVLRICEEMLSLMGLACIKGKGEAEALCAYLNEAELVDGCISQDSDCFAYGAKTVYRNFSISKQGAHASCGGAVDVYHIHNIMKALNLGRNKIIALALLCGSDYSDGVFGVGKEAVMRYFENVSEEDILDKLRSWKTDTGLYDDLYKKLNNKHLCTSCGHNGKLNTHTKLGCKECKSTSGCDSTLFKEKRIQIKNEISIRSKAISDSTFPNEELIKEFLIGKENMSKLDLKWKLPNMMKFLKFALKHLQWEAVYTIEKFLPILTRWQLLHFDLIQSSNQEGCNLEGLLQPKRINKTRHLRGVASYEVIWYDVDGYYNNIITPCELKSINLEKLWSTIEPQELFKKAYPIVVETYEASKRKPKKTTKRKTKLAKSIENIEEMLANTSITIPEKKRSKKVKAVEKCKTIDSYFKQVISSNVEKNDVLNELSFNLDESKFGDEDDSDISNILQEIINRSPPKYIRENLTKLSYNQFIDMNSSSRGYLNKSDFFINQTEEIDLFEKSMNFVCDSSDDEPLELEEAISNDVDNKIGNNENEMLDDTYSEEYIPLITRIKLKL